MRESMGFAEGMVVGMVRSAGKTDGKVFDWRKAAELIREKQPNSAEAGLSGDWDYTAGVIYRNGAIVPRLECYTYLASLWATPMLILSYANGKDEEIECWIAASESDYDAHTYWPDDALAILQQTT